MLSKKTKDRLDKWVWKKEFLSSIVSVPSDVEEEELSIYKPDIPVKLYRGLSFEQVEEGLEDKKLLTSFTYEKALAEVIANISDSLYYDPSVFSGEVISRIVSPEEILVDFTQLPDSENYLNEVIVYK